MLCSKEEGLSSGARKADKKMPISIQMLSSARQYVCDEAVQNSPDTIGAFPAVPDDAADNAVTWREPLDCATCSAGLEGMHVHPLLRN